MTDFVIEVRRDYQTREGEIVRCVSINGTEKDIALFDDGYYRWRDSGLVQRKTERPRDIVAYAPQDVTEGRKDDIDDDPNSYSDLKRVLGLALEQASGGKGAQRHGQGKPFDRQPMMEISRMLNGSPIGCMYQAIKKTQEASRMDVDAAQRELLGAINYLAGAYLLLEESAST